MGHARAKTLLPRLKAEEGGFTLIEMMMATAILSVVLIAIYGLLDVSVRIAPQDQERGHAMQESQAGVYRMTRELRQAHQVLSGDADTITVRVIPTGATAEVTVTWECAAPHPSGTPGMRRCTRTAGGGSSEVVVDRVINDTRPVFQYDAAPTAAKYVRATVVVPARGDRNVGNGHSHEIILADGFYMRNRDA